MPYIVRGDSCLFMLQAEVEACWEGWTPKAWVLGPNDSSG